MSEIWTEKDTNDLVETIFPQFMQAFVEYPEVLNTLTIQEKKAVLDALGLSVQVEDTKIVVQLLFLTVTVDIASTPVKLNYSIDLSRFLKTDS